MFDELMDIPIDHLVENYMLDRYPIRGLDEDSTPSQIAHWFLERLQDHQRVCDRKDWKFPAVKIVVLKVKRDESRWILGKSLDFAYESRFLRTPMNNHSACHRRFYNNSMAN
jgi:hypothetical protein